MLEVRETVTVAVLCCKVTVVVTVASQDEAGTRAGRRLTRFIGSTS